MRISCQVKSFSHLHSEIVAQVKVDRGKSNAGGYFLILSIRNRAALLPHNRYTEFAKQKLLLKLNFSAPG
jgi:hypothetical protein